MRWRFQETGQVTGPGIVLASQALATLLRRWEVARHQFILIVTMVGIFLWSRPLTFFPSPRERALNAQNIYSMKTSRSLKSSSTYIEELNTKFKILLLSRYHEREEYVLEERIKAQGSNS